ncbi:hypothetical protein [Streptomyces sp. HNM0574]|uniref:hypothetical protein n=1 Tax=Streptomyces sp. HNM0574 TaxID=2714954 RepID=UPI00146BAD68|nr:hypothetical protein [Streptomyces sp. HNM0574]NLU70479.1 hypothetical protein [Streptomyces sp. HNM0574]
MTLGIRRKATTTALTLLAAAGALGATAAPAGATPQSAQPTRPAVSFADEGGVQTKGVPPGCRIWSDYRGIWTAVNYRCDVDSPKQYRAVVSCEDPKTGSGTRTTGEWVNHRQTSTATCWMPKVAVMQHWEYRG